MPSIALAVTTCVCVSVETVVGPGIVVVVIPNDNGGRRAYMAMRRRWRYYWPVHPRLDAHRLTPVVRSEVGARACDRIDGQGSAEV